MCRLEQEMKTSSFFVMDENFLLQKPRALELLELMRKHNKAWGLYVFSSANAIRQYTMEQLIGLGVSWLWMGLEGKASRYDKLKNTDSRELVRELQENGIRVLGSSIIGLEEHTSENIDQAIAHAVSHNSDFHQFMLYTPVPGTPLYAELEAKGAMVSEDELALEDTHGQYRFNYRHPNIPAGKETEYLLRAFHEDFRVNGPSVLRQVRTAMSGWKKYRNHPEQRIRDRFAWEVEGMVTIFAGALWASKRWFKGNELVVKRLNDTLEDLYREFGLKARLAAPIIGRLFQWSIQREAKRLAAGRTYEPPTFYQRNYQDVVGKADVIKCVSGLVAAELVSK
jgi:radical SAM superfamily enzyme YgiQ (UPF0313 family)